MGDNTCLLSCSLLWDVARAHESREVVMSPRNASSPLVAVTSVHGISELCPLIYLAPSIRVVQQLLWGVFNW